MHGTPTISIWDVIVFLDAPFAPCRLEAKAAADRPTKQDFHIGLFRGGQTSRKPGGATSPTPYGLSSSAVTAAHVSGVWGGA